jgi:hypothetical protein
MNFFIDNHIILHLSFNLGNIISPESPKPVIKLKIPNDDSIERLESGEDSPKIPISKKSKSCVVINKKQNDNSLLDSSSFTYIRGGSRHPKSRKSLMPNDAAVVKNELNKIMHHLPKLSTQLFEKENKQKKQEREKCRWFWVTFF